MSSLIPSSNYHAFAYHQERQVAIIDVGGNPAVLHGTVSVIGTPPPVCACP